MLAHPLKRAIRLLSLWLLLLVAQQGGAVHELSHIYGSTAAAVKVDSSGIDKTCALCPAFAQATSPALSLSFHVPLLERVAPDLIAAPLFAQIDAAVPSARSRGPPV
jgi:hypothetical protein